MGTGIGTGTGGTGWDWDGDVRWEWDRNRNTGYRCQCAPIIHTGTVCVGRGVEIRPMVYLCEFPLRLAFVMTINKSQGQSLKHVGLDSGLLFLHIANFMSVH